MRMLKALPLILTLLSVVACEQKMRSARSSTGLQPQVESKVPTEEAPEMWALEDANVVCSESSCPAPVGVLLFFSDPDPVTGKVSIKRCTAFLSTRIQITTAGHCDHSATHRGYFLAQRVHGKPVMRKIARLERKEHTPHSSGDPDRHSIRPDVAVFVLERPIMEIDPADIARMGDQKTSAWSVFVVNKKDDKMNFTIDRLSCLRRRHEMIFPFNLTEQPDMMYGFGCRSVSGNSGAPVYSVDTGLVEGVVAGDSLVASPSILVTNLRCLRSKGCESNDEAARASRFQEMEQKNLESLNRNDLDESAYGLQFSVRLVQLNKPKQAREYEQVYTPVCRTRDVQLREVVFPVKHIRLSYDEWGRIIKETLGAYEAKGRVLERFGKRYVLSVDWSRSYGRPVKANEHPRDVWGSSFKIDLPLCAR